MRRILIIDDEKNIRNLLTEFLEGQGYEVASAPDGATGLRLLKEERFDLFLLDLMLPEISGMDILIDLSSQNINVPCIVITGFATVQTAVEALKLGAYDYITKPFTMDNISFAITRALDTSKLQRENIRLKKELRKTYGSKNIIGNSDNMQNIISIIDKIADTNSTVLITGESGTGKELIAKTIHYHSSRAQKPFVPISCAAIPRDILESELFGHEKGAFTGATTTRLGRFELANNGTLFLDEIGDLDPSLQVKLLRVLQEREFERVGSAKTIKVDVRIIAATNRNLEKAIEEGIFREDLYYRLNVIPMHLPPLRTMKEDIPLFIDHFVTEISKRKRKKPPTLPPETLQYLFNYRWPGNVRELENFIEKLVVLNEGAVVLPEDLPEKFHKKQHIKQFPLLDFKLSPEGVELPLMVDSMEQNMIHQALKLSNGVKSKAARLLGLNRTTLIEKMKKKGMNSLGESVHIN